MKTRALSLVIAVLGTVGFASTAGAGVHCSAGGCKIGKAPALKMQPQAGPSNQYSRPAPIFYSPPIVAPLGTTPLGQTYGRWAAGWWQWALGVPAAKNPVSDTTGAYCSQHQVGDVWFLAGAFTTDAVVRNCNVPAGKSLFFPLVNIFYAAFLNDPPEIRTEEYVRSIASCSVPATISVQIDGYKVVQPERYFTGSTGSQSPFFNVQLPPGNIYGLVDDPDPNKGALDLTLSPSGEQGYYLFVWPLKPGAHTIKWQASGCSVGFKQDITYKLNVVR